MPFFAMSIYFMLNLTSLFFNVQMYRLTVVAFASLLKLSICQLYRLLKVLLVTSIKAFLCCCFLMPVVKYYKFFGCRFFVINCTFFFLCQLLLVFFNSFIVFSYYLFILPGNHNLFSVNNFLHAVLRH